MQEKGWFRLPVVRPEQRLNYHSFFLIFDSVTDADRVREALLRSDIHAYIGYVPLHSSPMGRRLGYTAEDLPLTQEYASRVLRLPFHNQLSRDDVERVADVVAAQFGSRAS